MRPLLKNSNKKLLNENIYKDEGAREGRYSLHTQETMAGMEAHVGCIIARCYLKTTTKSLNDK